MSTYIVEKLPGERIVVSRASEGFDIKRDMSAMHADLRQLLDTFDGPGFYIADTLNTPMDFDDLMSASTTLMDKTSASLHPNVKETLLLIESEMLKLAAQGFGSDAFGNVPMKVFSSMDEALDYARANP